VILYLAQELVEGALKDKGGTVEYPKEERKIGDSPQLCKVAALRRKIGDSPQLCKVAALRLE